MGFFEVQIDQCVPRSYTKRREGGREGGGDYVESSSLSNPNSFFMGFFEAQVDQRVPQDLYQ